jgi:hypothetical protein
MYRRDGSTGSAREHGLGPRRTEGRGERYAVRVTQLRLHAGMDLLVALLDLRNERMMPQMIRSSCGDMLHLGGLVHWLGYGVRSKYGVFACLSRTVFFAPMMRWLVVVDG